MICPSCGETVPSGPQFCKLCGKPLPAPRTATPEKLQPMAPPARSEPNPFLELIGRLKGVSPIALILIPTAIFLLIFLNVEWAKVKAGKPSLLSLKPLPDKEEYGPKKDFDIGEKFKAFDRGNHEITPEGRYDIKKVFVTEKWLVRYHSANWAENFELPDYRLLYPADDKYLLIVRVEMQNRSKQVEEFSAKREPVFLRDGVGNRYDIVKKIYSNQFETLVEKLSPDEMKTATMCFEVPKNKRQFLLVMQFRDGARGYELMLNPPPRRIR